MCAKNQIIQKLLSYKLGLKRKTVMLQPPHPQWAEAFEIMREFLAQSLRELSLVTIEHVGSTSIPGLAAKPVLDILIVVENPHLAQKAVSLLEAVGFMYKGDGVARVTGARADLTRHFFSFYDELDTDFVHVHLYSSEHSDISRLLHFRDRLRVNEAIRSAYESLKLSLWQQGQIRSAYTLAKSEFIARALKE